MKRFALLFAVSVILGSCAQELEVLPSSETSQESGKIILPEGVQAVLHASVDNDADSDDSTETRTSYDEDGKFNWSGNETVALLLYKSESNPCDRLKSINYTTTDSGRSADFYLDETSLYTGHTTPETGWLSSGIAVYPYGMMTDHISTNNGYGAPFIKIRSSVKYGSDSAKRTGDSSEIILLGTPDGDHFSFKTAMAVLKVTMTGIPADAVALQLYTTNQDTYPLSGDFKLHIEGDKEIKNTDYTLYKSEHTGDPYISIDLSSDGAIDSRDFYFNIPTATYPANTLKVRLLDANGNVMMQRSIQKEFTFNRNDMVTATLDCPSSMSVYMNGNANTPRINWNTKVRSFRFNITSAEGNTPSDYTDGNKWTQSSYANWNTGAQIESFVSTSGKYYFNYLVCSNTSLPSALTDNNVVAYGTIPFYYINDTDKAQLAGDYTISNSSWTCGACAENNPNLTKKMILAVSNNPQKGNIMMTEFLGYNCDVSENRSTASLNWSGSLEDGAPLYGIYPNSVSDYTCISFLDVNSQEGLFRDNAGSYYPRNNATNQPNYHFIVTSTTVLTCMAGTTAFAKRSAGAWNGSGTKVLMGNVVATKTVE